MKFIYRLLSKWLARRNFYFIKALAYDSKDRIILRENLDFVRQKTLELCSAEITRKRISGSVAELGVYKGDFAVKINEVFPARALYLFDTFAGFDNRDMDRDRHHFSTKHQDFSDTHVEAVRKRMPYPDLCVFKKGYFPDTALDITDTFCFVSIDADLYDPILNGLAFFYPRLEKNGYIFVHDFNNRHFKGAREAVLQYCSLNNIGYVPIPDDGGSVIITK